MAANTDSSHRRGPQVLCQDNVRGLLGLGFQTAPLPSPSELALTFPLSKMDYPKLYGSPHSSSGKNRASPGGIAQIQELNKEHQRQSGNSAEAQVAHVERQERLHAKREIVSHFRYFA